MCGNAITIIVDFQSLEVCLHVNHSLSYYEIDITYDMWHSLQY